MHVLKAYIFLNPGYSSRHLLQAAWQGNFQLVKKLLVSVGAFCKV